ncbi:hypothetical protein F2M50_10745 [Escherichia coli]|nr:hypothetical protein [Escherichia coli]
MGSCAAPSAKGDDKFITTDYLQQCPQHLVRRQLIAATISSVSILDCAIQNRRKNNDGFLYMIGFAGHCHFQKTTAPDNAV